MIKTKKKIKIALAIFLAVVIAAAVVIYPRYNYIRFLNESMYNVFDDENGQIEWDGKIYNRLFPLNDWNHKIDELILFFMGSEMIAFNDYKSGAQIGTLDGNRRWRVFELAGEHEDDFIVATDGKLRHRYLYIADKGLPTLETTEKIEIGMTLEEVFIIMGRQNQGIGSIYVGGTLFGWETDCEKMFWVTYNGGEVVNTEIRDINR
jgi:hypothetical protein